MFILGLSSGLGSSYVVFYPQINSLNASIDTFVKLQIEQDRVIQSLESNDNLLNEEINSLKLNNSRLLIQLNETQTLLNKEISLNQITKSKNHIEPLNDSFLEIVDNFQNSEIIINNNTAYQVTGTIVNYGTEDVENIQVKITWWVLSGCGCDSLPQRSEIIKIKFIPGRSSFNVDETFNFSFPKFQFLRVEFV
jgi:hypothetical protein